MCNAEWYFRYTYGGVDLRARQSANEKLYNADPELDKGERHGEGEEGYQIFKMDFERVELPFIIALWILVASLAKVGKNHYPQISQNI